jgi:hypothetical protein
VELLVKLPVGAPWIVANRLVFSTLKDVDNVRATEDFEKCRDQIQKMADRYKFPAAVQEEWAHDLLELDELQYRDASPYDGLWPEDNDGWKIIVASLTGLTLVDDAPGILTLLFCILYFVNFSASLMDNIYTGNVFSTLFVLIVLY